jgi:hypothetical protein
MSQIIFPFALDLDMIPLTGTTNPAHMKADLRKSSIFTWSPKRSNGSSAWRRNDGLRGD